MFDVLGVGKGSALGSSKKDICDILTFLKFPTFFFKIFKRSDPLNVDRSRLASNVVNYKILFGNNS